VGDPQRLLAFLETDMNMLHFVISDS